MITRRITFILALASVLGTVPFLGAVESAFGQVTADGVTDRSSLRAFVERARDHAAPSVAGATEQEAFDFFDREFRSVGQWRQGPIYLFVIEAEGADRGTVLFHAPRQDLEGRNLWTLEDKNGIFITQGLIANAGSDFLEYYFDNPDVEGDEDDGSLKIGYAEELSIGGATFIIGSGFYPATGTPIAPPFALLLLTALLAAGGAYRRRHRR